MADKWRNRILGTGEEDPTQLLANPRNWRRHPVPQRKALRGSLSTVGWVQQVMVNQRTGFVVDGHARIEEAITNGEPTVPVLYVDLSEDEEALVLATLDPIGALAESDTKALAELLAEISTSDKGLQDLLTSLAASSAPEVEKYTDAVNVPQYEITGEDPPVASLYDTTKTDALAAQIVAVEEIPGDLRTFLLAAASRHVVFNYALIAEAYAHASPEVQRLFEASALVIIDVADAIREGYVRFTKVLADLEDREDA